MILTEHVEAIFLDPGYDQRWRVQGPMCELTL